jgi:tetratricopeptide (TPR) repeat protein
MRGTTSLLLASLALPHLPPLPTLLPAQSPPTRPTVAEHIARGDSAHAALAPAEALRHYEAALASDSTNYAALWRASREVVDIAKQIEGKDDSSKHLRDSLYSEARALAESAAAVNPAGAEGHFMIAQALGRLARTRGGKERVRFARIIYDEAMKAIELDSAHDGAHHVIGAWNAEIKRLSGIQRFFAKTLFGAGFMNKANWNDAERYLEKAVALNPQHIYHRLELAGVYIDVGKYSKAREQLITIGTLPIADVLDRKYQHEGAQLIEDIKGEKDER